MAAKVKHHKKKSSKPSSQQQQQQQQNQPTTITVVVADPNSNSRNVCFTAPDGPLPILVQSLSFMSFAASFGVWITSWVDNASFACFQQSPYDSTNATPLCYDLAVNSGLYTFQNNVWYDGWQGAITFGAVFGGIATTLGFIIVYSTFSACCFRLSPPKLRSLSIMSVIASICQILTLVSLESSLHLANSYTYDGMFNITEGGSLAIAASILYITLAWCIRDLRKNVTAQNGEENEIGTVDEEVDDNEHGVGDEGEHDHAPEV